jgi:hypothetical protein
MKTFSKIITALLIVLCMGLVMTSFVSCFDDEPEDVAVTGKRTTVPVLVPEERTRR